MSLEAMRQALEALENYVNVVTSSNDPKDFGGVVDGGEPARQAITALRQAIEFQEMVAKGTKAWADTPDNWVDELRGGAEKPWVKTYAGGKPNYTTPEKQEPVAWHEPGAYGNVTTHKDWALANGWEPLYKERT